MKLITQLGNWEVKSHYISEIQFSVDSKYLTYTPTSFQNAFPVNIYNLEDLQISKSITKLNFQYSTCGVILLDNHYYIIRGMNLATEAIEVRICKLSNHEVVFQTNDFMKYVQTAKFDAEKKYLFCNTPALKTFCFDLNNIISGIPNDTQFNIKYLNKKLIIDNNDKLISQLSIMTIDGREVYRYNFLPKDKNTYLEIPLELSNGLYLVNIASGINNFVHKLLIKE